MRSEIEAVGLAPHQLDQAAYVPSTQTRLEHAKGARGGRGNRHVPVIVPPIALAPPKDSAGLRDALGKIMADVHNGILDTKRATTAVYAGMAFLKALETSDLEFRIRSLEERADASIQKQN